MEKSFTGESPLELTDAERELMGSVSFHHELHLATLRSHYSNVAADAERFERLTKIFSVHHADIPQTGVPGFPAEAAPAAVRA